MLFYVVDHACLPLCSFAQACEGRSLQVGTSELAFVTSCSPVRESAQKWIADSVVYAETAREMWIDLEECFPQVEAAALHACNVVKTNQRESNRFKEEDVIIARNWATTGQDVMNSLDIHQTGQIEDQDLTKKKLIGVGEMRDGVYYFKQSAIPIASLVIQPNNNLV
uniref:Uncharacterized protein n=1 Tax=Ananas comosus var. bracteatus TaxID=296719 RepID=A0A6V7NF16_ANACO|nr:unnamed protein product [Ananas comosus var. bracteatus]